MELVWRSLWASIHTYCIRLHFLACSFKRKQRAFKESEPGSHPILLRYCISTTNITQPFPATTHRAPEPEIVTEPEPETQGLTDSVVPTGAIVYDISTQLQGSIDLCVFSSN